jgi:AbrB family looped-hinge helix DNA binding protein
MARTVVSSKFQIVIPKDVREDAGIRTGQVLHVVSKKGVITLVPDEPLSKLRGFLKGMATRGLREKRDRL